MLLVLYCRRQPLPCLRCSRKETLPRLTASLQCQPFSPCFYSHYTAWGGVRQAVAHRPTARHTRVIPQQDARCAPLCHACVGGGTGTLGWGRHGHAGVRGAVQRFSIGCRAGACWYSCLCHAPVFLDSFTVGFPGISCYDTHHIREKPNCYRRGNLPDVVTGRQSNVNQVISPRRRERRKTSCTPANGAGWC